MRGIRVMHVQDSLGMGGTENGIVNIVNGLDPYQFQTSLCCLKKVGEFAGRLGRPVKIFDMAQPEGKALTLPLRLAWLFFREKVDIVHTHGFYCGLYAVPAAWVARVPVIIHGEHGMCLDERAPRWRYTRWFSHLADQLLVVCDSLGKALCRRTGISESKVAVILNGVDTLKFSPGPKSPGVLNSLGIPHDHLLVGTVGRLAEVKDYPTLLAGFRRVAETMDKVTLCFVGDGPDRENLIALSREMGIGRRVVFAGTRKDMPEVYRAFDLFVLTSVIEGMSNVILEAMSSGISVLATDVGGNPELVVHGRTGLLIPPGNPDELAAAMIKLLNGADLRREMGLSGRARAEGSFTMGRMVKDYEELYMRLALAKGAGRQ